MNMIKLVTGGLSLSAAALLLSGCVLDEYKEKHTQYSGDGSQWWQVHNGKGQTGNYYGGEGQQFHHHGNEHGSVHAHKRADHGTHHMHHHNDKMNSMEHNSFHHHSVKDHGSLHMHGKKATSHETNKNWYGKYSDVSRPGFHHVSN